MTQWLNCQKKINKFKYICPDLTRVFRSDFEATLNCAHFRNNLIRGTQERRDRDSLSTKQYFADGRIRAFSERQQNYIILWINTSSSSQCLSSFETERLPLGTENSFCVGSQPCRRKVTQSASECWLIGIIMCNNYFYANSLVGIWDHSFLCEWWEANGLLVDVTVSWIQTDLFDS